MKILVWVLVLLVGVGGQIGLGQAGVGPPVVKTFAGPTRGHWGDQGDGTYANPIVPGDFSDLDAIRVGDEFYAISSTFQYSPGMVVLESKDLVNWRVAGHVVSDILQISPEMNWDKMGRAGKGIWAGGIRFHGGRFWVYFGTPDEGLFMSSAAKVEGPWTPLARVLPEDGWDDPCPFWDEDGQGYLVTTRYKTEADGKGYHIHLFKLTADGRGLVAGYDKVIHQSRGSEANKLYKIHGRYFHFFSEVRPEGRVVMMGRAKSLEGPWEVRQVIHVKKAVDKEPNQGGLVELADGRWYFVTHQGTGDWEGRAMVLLPVTWPEDADGGWPVLGEPGADGIGNMVWGGKKPIAGGALAMPVASDDFGSAVLRGEWEWMNAPRAGKWSLTERAGWLRLRAWAPARVGDFESTGDMLTQRAMRGETNEVTVKMDAAGMAAGEEGGLAHYAKTFAWVGVGVGADGVRRVEVNENGAATAGPEVKGLVWLRSSWGFAGKSGFSYSLDGKTFVAIGGEYQLTWAHYRGDRVALWTGNAQGEKGLVDFTEFRYKVRR